MEVVARTGCGIITNQGAYPDKEGFGKAYVRQLSIAEDRFIPGFARVADLIHAAGALGVQQILHAELEGAVAPFMPAHDVVVEIDLGNVVHRVELE